MHMCAVCVKLAISTVEEASGSDSLEQKKRSTIWSFFVIDNEDKTKVVCLTCKGKVSRGGKHPKSFNKSNLRKHLEGLKDKFKDYIEQEKKRRELSSSKGSYKQVTLEALAEKHKPYAADHPRAKIITQRIAR